MRIQQFNNTDYIFCQCSFYYKYIILFTLKDLRVIVDGASTVGQYSPVTLTFNPATSIASGVLIQVSPVILGDNPTDCISDIPTISALSSYTCSYSSNVVTLTYTGSTTLTSTNSVSITINNAKYTSKMSATSITLSLKASASCKIESATDTTNWIPSNPAKFQTSSTFSLHSSSPTTTCNTGAILQWSLQPSLEISTSQLVVLTIVGGATPNTGLIVGTGLTGATVSGQTIQGTPTKTWVTTNPTSIISYYFTLPATEQPFSSTVTTYASGTISTSDIVHLQTFTNVAAARQTIVSTNKITNINNLVVSETGTYQLVITVPCGLSTSAKFDYTIPTPFTGICTTTNCALTDNQHFTISQSVISPISASGSFTLQFSLINPPTTQAIPSTSTFTIVGMDSSYASFSISAVVASSVIIQSGSLSSFSVSATSPQVGASTSYTLSMTANHKILAGSSLIFTFPSSVNTASATLGTITVNNAPVYGATFVASTLSVSGLFSTDITKTQTFSVVLSSIINPYSICTVTGFGVTVKYGTDSIDSSIGGSVQISSAASGTLKITIADQTNYAENTYTFTLTSTFPFNNAGSNLVMAVNIPSEVSYCDATTVATATTGATISSPATGNPFSFNIALTSAITSFVFTVTCKNPLSTKETSPFTTTLSTPSGSQILTATATVTTSKGRIMGVLSAVTNIPTYPSTATISKFSISRAGGQIAINRIKVQVPYANTAVSCTVSAGTATCAYASGYMVIDFDAATYSTSFTISNIGSTNPDTPALASSQFFVVDTYILGTGTNYYLVDHLDSAGTLTVSCINPCQTCSTSTTFCTQCLNQGTSVYLYTDTGTCGSSTCGSTYLADTTKFQCNKCTSPCKSCTGSLTYCSSCISTDSFVLNGLCVASCGNNYYAPTGSQTCQQCTSPCLNCVTTGTNCQSCVSGYNLYSATCVQNCPDHTYANSAECKTCDSSCYNCSGSATICTSCYLGSYLSGVTCISSAACISDNQHVAVNSVCTACSSPCSTCKTSADQCTSCTGVLLLMGNTCVSSCPSQYYTSGTSCLACSSSCDGCIDSASKCLACKSGTYLVQTTQSCVVACATNYYLSGTNCLLCDSSCYTCSQNSMSCTSCSTNLYLFGNKCVSTCPTSTYTQGTQCLSCSTTCAACTGISTACTSCGANMYLNSNTCVSSCPSGMTAISATCQACTGQCGTCAGSVSYCTSCITSSLYLYGGKCYTSCPTTTIVSQNASMSQTCVDCMQGCDTCIWNGNNTGLQNCTKCSATYKILNSSCYYACPTLYSVSNDGLSCMLTSLVNVTQNNTTNNNTNITTNSTTNATNITISTASTQSIIFPHFIAAALFVLIGFAGVAFDHRSFLCSNIIALWSVVFFVACGIQSYLAYMEKENLLLYITGGVFVIHIILDIIFICVIRSKIQSDKGFINWVSMHSCSNCFIQTISTIFSYQLTRFYISRFFGLSTYFVQFTDFSSFLVPIKLFSTLSMILSYFPILIIDIYTLLDASWNSQLYNTMIETSVIGVCLLLIICIDMFILKNAKKELEEDANYSAINNDSKIGLNNNDITTRLYNDEDIRHKILQDVWSRIGNHNTIECIWPLEKVLEHSSSKKSTKGKIKRRKSLPLVDVIQKEPDPKLTHSYPCSPKTAQEKEIPLKIYGINNGDTFFSSENQIDNVYSESSPPKVKEVTSAKITKEMEIQSPPFDKIEAFEKHIKKTQENRKRKKGMKLFDMTDNGKQIRSPLAIIQESQEDLEGKTIQGLDDSTTENKKKQINPELSSLCVNKPESQVPSKNSATLIALNSETGSSKNLNNSKEVIGEKSPSILDGNFIKSAGKDGSPQTKRTEKSPPQSPTAAQNTILSKPMNLDELNKNGNISRINLSEAKRREDVKPVTLVDKLKTPEIFMDDGNFEFSLQKVKAEDFMKKSTKEEEEDYKKLDEEKKEIHAELNPIKETKKINEIKKDDTANKMEEKKIEIAPTIEDKKPEIKNQESKVKVEIIAENPKSKNNVEEEYIDDTELMGAFNRDPIDNSILIIENANGQLVDLNGRLVNKHGHLIDEKGNVINVKGKIVFTKEEADKEYGEEELSKPTPAINPLFQNPEEKKVEAKSTPIEEYKGKEEENISHKSASLNSLMEDTPSNYNMQNQRYDEQIEKPKETKMELKNLPEEPGESSNASEIKAKEEYGVKPAPKKWRKRKQSIKAANKTQPQNLFKRANKSKEYMTDEEEKANAEKEEEEKKHVIGNKPSTARSNLHSKKLGLKRKAHSRKPEKEEKKLVEEDIFEKPIEDMFLPSEEDDNKSIDSALHSHGSKPLINEPKVRGLEDIYLQRLESSLKHKKKQNKKANNPEQIMPKRMESEKDEISSLLNENYTEMKNQFNRNASQAQPTHGDEADIQNPNPRKMKLRSTKKH